MHAQAFGPFVFYDTDSRESIPEGSSSLVNVMEVEMVLCVYTQLMQCHPQLRGKDSVAVISPYKAQVRLPQTKKKHSARHMCQAPFLLHICLVGMPCTHLLAQCHTDMSEKSRDLMKTGNHKSVDLIASCHVWIAAVLDTRHHASNCTDPPPWAVSRHEHTA